MAQHQCTDKLFLRLSIFLGIDQYRQSSRYTLIATARITHYGNHGTCHTGITSTGSIRKDMREYTVSQYLMFISTSQNLTQAMTIIPFKRTFGGSFVQTGGFQNEPDFVQWSSQSKIIDFAQGQFQCMLFRLVARFSLLVEQHFIVTRHVYKASMSAGNNGGRFIFPGLTAYFYIKLFLYAIFQ